MAATLEELRDEHRCSHSARILPSRTGPATWMNGARRCCRLEAANRSELSDDLLSYGYSLLLHGLRYTDLGGDAATARKAFEVSAEALEAVVERGAPVPSVTFTALSPQPPTT